MSEAGLGRKLIFVVSFLGIFTLLVGAMPSQLYETEPEYYGRDIPDYFEGHLQTAVNFNDTVTINLTFNGDSQNFYLNSEEFAVRSYLRSGTRTIVYQHNAKLFFISNWHFMTNPNDVVFIELDDANEFFDSGSNGSMFDLDCMHYTVTTILSYNTTAYDDLTDAWNNNDIYCLVGWGISGTGTSTTSYGLVARLLFFQMPEIHPVLNAIIALPIWTCIAYLVYRLILLAIPFVG